MEESQLTPLPQSNPAELPSSEKPYAKFTVRAAASVLDNIIVTLGISLPIFLLVSFLHLQNSHYGQALGAILGFCYAVIFIKKYGATLGKQFFKIKVVGDKGQKITWTKSIIREIGKLISWIVLFLGYIWAIFDKRKQTWHDKLAHTIVVQNESLSKGRKILAYFLAYGLVLLALLGIAAVIALVAINPSEQLKRTQEAADKAKQLQMENQQKMDESNSMYETITPSYINPDTGVPDSPESF